MRIGRCLAAPQLRVFAALTPRWQRAVPPSRWLSWAGSTVPDINRGGKPSRSRPTRVPVFADVRGAALARAAGGLGRGSGHEIRAHDRGSDQRPYSGRVFVAERKAAKLL